MKISTLRHRKTHISAGCGTTEGSQEATFSFAGRGGSLRVWRWLAGDVVLVGGDGEAGEDVPVLDVNVVLLRMLVVVVIGSVLLVIRRRSSVDGVGGIAVVVVVVVVVWSCHVVFSSWSIIL